MSGRLVLKGCPGSHGASRLTRGDGRDRSASHRETDAVKTRPAPAEQIRAGHNKGHQRAGDQQPQVFVFRQRQLVLGLEPGHKHVLLNKRKVVSLLKNKSLKHSALKGYIPLFVGDRAQSLKLELRQVQTSNSAHTVNTRNLMLCARNLFCLNHPQNVVFKVARDEGNRPDVNGITACSGNLTRIF